MYKDILHGDYTSYRTIKQLKLPFEFEYHISADDPVRLVDTFVEEMDLSDLYKTYSRIRKNQATPAQLLKIPWNQLVYPSGILRKFRYHYAAAQR